MKHTPNTKRAQRGNAETLYRKTNSISNVIHFVPRRKPREIYEFNIAEKFIMGTLVCIILLFWLIAGGAV